MGIFDRIGEKSQPDSRTKPTKKTTTFAAIPVAEPKSKSTPAKEDSRQLTEIDITDVFKNEDAAQVHDIDPQKQRLRPPDSFKDSIDDTYDYIYPDSPRTLYLKKKKIESSESWTDYLSKRFIEGGIITEHLSPGEVLELVNTFEQQAHALYRNGKKGPIDPVTERAFAYNGLSFLELIRTKKIEISALRGVSSLTIETVSLGLQMSSSLLDYARQKLRWWGIKTSKADREENNDVDDNYLNSKLGNFIERYFNNLEAKKKEALSKLSKEKQIVFRNYAISGLAYEQLYAFANERNEKLRATYEDPDLDVCSPLVGIKQKENYDIVIYKGTKVKKIKIPGKLINIDASSRTKEEIQQEKESNHRDFHRILFDEINDSNSSGWIETSELQSPAAKSIKNAKKASLQGKANIQEAKERRVNPENFNAGDLKLILIPKNEATTDKIERDYRTSPFGSEFPSTLTFGIDDDNNIDSYSAFYSHQYSVGAEAFMEKLKVSTWAFDTAFKLATEVDTYHEQEIEQPDPLKSEELFFSKEQLVWDTTINRDKYDKRINKLREILNKNPLFTAKYKVDINLPNLLTQAIMIALKRNTGDFLEKMNNPYVKDKKEQVGLGPAPMIVTDQLAYAMRREHSPEQMHDDFFLELILSLKSVTLTREATKAGYNFAQIFDTFLKYEFIRNGIRQASRVFDSHKNETITRTMLFSFLVRGSEPLVTHNDYLSMAEFTTSFSREHQLVCGACDVINPKTGKNEVRVTLRQKENARSKKRTVNNFIARAWDRINGQDPDKNPGENLVYVDMLLDRIITDLEYFAEKLQKEYELEQEEKFKEEYQKEMDQSRKNHLTSRLIDDSRKVFLSSQRGRH